MNKDQMLCGSLIFLLIALFGPLAAIASTNAQASPSLKCVLAKQFEAHCSFDYDANSDLKSIEVTLNRIPKKTLSLAKYPKESESTVALILIDTSDPSRKKTVRQNITIADTWIKDKAPHQKIALGYFNHDLTLVRDFDGKIIEKSQARPGQATEFYKNMISAIDLLDKQSGARKVLIVFSDGKVEDAAYSHAQTVARAKAAGVKIVALGIAEKASETPYLQNLEVLAKESRGRYYQADINTNQLSSEIIKNPLAFAEKGGSFKLDIGELRGEARIETVLFLQDTKKLSAKADIVIPDGRAKTQKILDYIKQNALYLGLAILVLTFLLVYIAKRRRSKNNKKPEPIYGYLEEMDGLCTKHAIKKKAVRIGRSEHNDIVFQNNSVSMHHAELFLQRNSEFSIVDLNSTNGVLVNDVKVAQSVLNNRDVVEIGEVRLRFIDTNVF